MANRKGGLSIVRISIIAAIIGGVIIAAAAVTYLTDQASKRTPLEVVPYPGAAFWGESEERATSRNVFYLSADTPEDIAMYYQQKMNEHYGNAEQRCVRIPATGDAPGADTNPNVAPFVYRCMFDNSGFNSSQFTQVEIYPGKANEVASLSAEGQTIIKYEQQWQN